MLGENIIIIVNQIVILTLLGLTGFIAGKKKYLPEESGTILSRVVVKLTAPFLIATTMMNYKFEANVLWDGLIIYILGLFFLLLAFFVSIPLSRGMKLEGAASNIYRMQSVYGNVIFLAYPLLGSIFGDKGIIYAVFYNLANDTLLWTIGIYLVNRHNTQNFKDNLKHLINGNTVAFGIGIICIITNFQYWVGKYPDTLGKAYDLLFETFNKLGHTTIYLSMIFIGLILAKVKIGNLKEFIFKRYPILVLTMMKLLIIPLIALLVLFLIGNRVDSFVKTIVVLQLAMPASTIVAALASQYNSDYKFATECVFMSTIFGMITIPLMVYLVQMLF